MMIEEMSDDQIALSLRRIEETYALFNGSIDLLLMSKKVPELFATWRLLRNAQRQRCKATPAMTKP